MQDPGVGEFLRSGDVHVEHFRDVWGCEPARPLQMIGVTLDVVGIADEVHVYRRERLTGTGSSPSLIEYPGDLSVGLFGR